MALGNFTKARTTAAAGKPAATSKKSRYAGIEAAQPREPMPNEGEYLFVVVDCEEGTNPGKGTDSFKSTLEVVESEGANVNKPGEHVKFVQLLTGKGGPAGLARTKSYIMAAAGFDDEAAYNEFDPDGEFIEACVGAQNKYTETGGIAGRLVFCRVRRGNPTPDGLDFYREFEWAPVPDSDPHWAQIAKAS